MPYRKPPDQAPKPMPGWVQLLPNYQVPLSRVEHVSGRMVYLKDDRHYEVTARVADRIRAMLKAQAALDAVAGNTVRGMLERKRAREVLADRGHWPFGDGGEP